jgi:hypothetical protein
MTDMTIDAEGINGMSKPDDNTTEPPSLLHCTDDRYGDPVVLIPENNMVSIAALDSFTDLDKITADDMGRNRIDLGPAGAVRLGRCLLSYAAAEFDFSNAADSSDIGDLTRHDLEAMQAELARTMAELGDHEG